MLERWLRTAASLAGTLVLAVMPVAAQERFPNRAIQIIHPYPPGGTTDGLVRALTPGMSSRLGQSVVVVNRDGAAGAIGTGQVARAAPDGYTLAFVPALVVSTLPHAQPSLGYRVQDLIPVCQTFENIMALVTRSDSPIRNLTELVALARARPGGLSFGTLGVGSIPHLASIEFQDAANVTFGHVPYRGDGPVLTELLGGRLDFAAIVAGSIAGRDLRVLTVFHGERHPLLPEVPTAREMGFDVAPTSFGGLLAPAGTPASVVAVLEAACAGAAADPLYRTAAQRAFQPASYYLGAAAFGERLARDIADKARILARLDLQR